MTDELLEADAVEELAGELTSAVAQSEVRALAEPAEGAALQAWHQDARTVAVAAAGGLVIGAATVAAVKAALAARGAHAGLSGLRRRDRSKVVASRSFLVDIHVLGR